MTCTAVIASLQGCARGEQKQRRVLLLALHPSVWRYGHAEPHSWLEQPREPPSAGLPFPAGRQCFTDLGVEQPGSIAPAHGLAVFANGFGRINHCLGERDHHLPTKVTDRLIPFL